MQLLELAPNTVGHSCCEPSPRIDPIGLHRLGCTKASSARIKRHDEVVSVIAHSAIAADPNAFELSCEQHLPEDEVTQSRPGDIALNLGEGRTHADLTIASPFASARVKLSRSAGSPAAAAAQAYDRKMCDWTAILDSNGLTTNLRHYICSIGGHRARSLGRALAAFAQGIFGCLRVCDRRDRRD